MRVQITVEFDTSEESEQAAAILGILSGSDTDEQAPAPAPAKKATKSTKKATAKKSTPSKPQPEPEAEEDPTEDSGDTSEEEAGEDLDTALLDDAVEKAQAMLREDGGPVKIREALDGMGVPKVTALETNEQVREFVKRISA